MTLGPATLAARLKLGAANAARIARAQAPHNRGACTGFAAEGTCTCYVLPLLQDLDAMRDLAGELYAIFKAGDWPGALPVDPRTGDRLTRADGSIFTYHSPLGADPGGWTCAHAPLTRRDGLQGAWEGGDAPEEDSNG